MPVKNLGEGKWQWGSGKIYSGPGARKKAIKQMKAAFAHGYKGMVKSIDNMLSKYGGEMNQNRDDATRDLPKKSKELLEKEALVILKCEKIIHKLENAPIDNNTLMKAFGNNPPEELLKDTKERPSKKWFESCLQRAKSFADSPESFCGNLWFNTEEHAGGEKAKESFGKSENIGVHELIDKAVVKPLPEGVGEIEEPEETPEEINDEDMGDFGGSSNIISPYKPQVEALKPAQKVITN